LDILELILYLTEIIACLLGFLYFKKVRGTLWQYFPFYLLFILVGETLGYISKMNKDVVFNQNLFQYIVIPSEFLFFFWLFYKSFGHKWQKYFSLGSSLIYLSILILNSVLVKNKVFAFFSISYTVGNLLLLIQILIFYLHLISSNELLNFRTNRLFWVSLGLLIFYLGTFPFFGLIHVLYKSHYEVYLVYKKIVMVLDSVMYIMFAISFIWGKTTNT
jgi:hypothetical protein